VPSTLDRPPVSRVVAGAETGRRHSQPMGAIGFAVYINIPIASSTNAIGPATALHDPGYSHSPVEFAGLRLVTKQLLKSSLGEDSPLRDVQFREDTHNPSLF